MSGYGFGKKPAKSPEGEGAGPEREDRLDFSGIQRAPVTLDPAREEAAIRRGDALGFVDRGSVEEPKEDWAGEGDGSEGPRRRRRSAQPQISVFIKGPKDTLDWFVDYTNQQGHRSYWQTLEKFRSLIEGEKAERSAV